MPIGTFQAIETAAEVDLVEYTNTTMQDAIQFGQTGDTWTLTGFTFKMEIKASRDDAVGLLTLTSPTQIVILDATNRIIQFNVPMATIDAALGVGQYVYDLIGTDALGVRTMFMHGKFCLEQGVTES